MRSPIVVVTLGALALGCPNKNPTAQVPVQGQEVQWGKGFGQPPGQGGQQPGSMPAGHAAQGQGQGQPGMGGDQPMMPTGEWAGGDPVQGRLVFASKCMGCHTKDGMGGKTPDGKPVPAITQDKLQGKNERDLARFLAHGHAGKDFMTEFDRASLTNLIAALLAGIGK